MKGSEVKMSMTPYEVERFETVIRENERLKLELEKLKEQLETLKKEQ